MNSENDFQSAIRTPPASADIRNAGTCAKQNQTSAGEAGFIDQKQLLARLPISRRTLFNWRTTGKIPCVRLGGRRILFHWPSVEAALLRHQHGGQS
jgi:predicted DNA-binding transcriptional regulator AlpA